MRVSIFGLGYVGCVSAACLADSGHEVIGVDINAEKVSAINAGESPIVEPGLAALVKRSVAEGRLMATSDVELAVNESDLALICVGTPGHANGKLNTEALEGVCKAIGRVLRDSHRPFTVVVRSTVLPGTIEKLLAPALYEAAGHRAGINIAVNPEFMREGTALLDFAQPPLTLVGCANASSVLLLRQIYSEVDAVFVDTDIRTAEMAKYVSNAWHAVKVCFANEIGNVCEALDADAQEVMRIFKLDRKLNISDAYLRPGFAFGGSCLPKDVRALNYAARVADVELPMLGGVIASNEAQIRHGIEKVLDSGAKRVGIAGLAFKPDTDDLRESPMVALVEALIGKGIDVRILDKNVSLARLTGANKQHIEEEIPHIASLMCDDEQVLLEHSEALVVTNTSDETARLVGDAAPGCTIIDLTQGALPSLHGASQPTPPAWQRMTVAAQSVH